MSEAKTFANAKIWRYDAFEEGNVVVRDGVITHIGEHTEGVVYDMTGLMILPGGIDPHVHLRDPGHTYKEDFFTGSMAAAKGGYTTILDMPNTTPSTTTFQALFEKQERARTLPVHVQFFFGATNDNLHLIEGLDALSAENKAAGVKVYYGSSTGNLLCHDQSMITKMLGLYTGVFVFHAEKEDRMNDNAKEFTEDSVIMHNKIRDSECAYQAVEEIVNAIPENCIGKVHIAHVSTRMELDVIRKAKFMGLPVTCEVAPHHLFLSENDLETLGNKGKMNPPLRSLDDQNALWEGILDGTIDCVATDHAPHTLEEKLQSYHSAPSGVPGLETALPLLLKAEKEGKLTWGKLHDLRVKRAREIFNLKSIAEIEIGEPGDLTVLDISAPYIIKNEDMMSKCGWTPFDGMEVPGKVVLTCVSGEIVYKESMYQLSLLT